MRARQSGHDEYRDRLAGDAIHEMGGAGIAVQTAPQAHQLELFGAYCDRTVTTKSNSCVSVFSACSFGIGAPPASPSNVKHFT